MDQQSGKKRIFQTAMMFVMLFLVIEIVLLLLQNRELRMQVADLSRNNFPDPLKLGEVVPSFSVLTMDGERERIEYDSSHQKYLLFIFSTTCPHCEKNLDVWNRLTVTNDTHLCKIEGISVHPLKETTEFVAVKKLDFQVLVLQDTSFRRAYRVGGVPETILLHNGGVVEKTWVGELSVEQVNEIRNLSGGKEPLIDKRIK